MQLSDEACGWGEAGAVVALAAAADSLAAPLAALAVEPRRFASPGAAIGELARLGAVPTVLVDAAQCPEWLDRLGGALAPARPRTIVVVHQGDADMAFLALERGADEVVAADADAAELGLALFGWASGCVRESGAAGQPTLADLSYEVARIARALSCTISLHARKAVSRAWFLASNSWRRPAQMPLSPASGFTERLRCA